MKKLLKNKKAKNLMTSSRYGLIISVLLFAVVGAGFYSFVTRVNKSIDLSLASANPSGLSLPNCNLNGWELSFTDDFDGTSVDSSKWGLYAEKNNQWGEFDPSLVTVANGMVTLSVVKKSDNSYRVSGMSNARSGAQLYGKYDIRLKTNEAVGVMPVTLLWPSGVPWPEGGEIDFMELFDSTRQNNNVTLHYADSSGVHKQIGRKYSADLTKWQTVGVEWVPGEVRYTLNGRVMATVTNSTAVPDNKMWLAMQHHLRNSWSKPVNGPQSSKLEVDWVAQYKYSPSTVDNCGDDQIPPSPDPEPSPDPVEGYIDQNGNLINNASITVNKAGEISTHPLGYVKDGDENTRWISKAQDNGILTIDMQKPYSFRKISILWAGDTTMNYNVQISKDGNTWLDVANGQTTNKSKELLEHDISTTLGYRYFRIITTDRWSSNYGNSIWELGVYGAEYIEPDSLNVNASKQSNGVALVTWDSYSGATQYIVSRNGVDDTGFGDWSTTIPGNENSYTFYRLLDDFDYTFKVEALNAEGQIVASGSANCCYVIVSNESDLNQDGKVDIVDLSILLSDWGSSNSQSDINSDGTVDIVDLSVLLSEWTG